MRLVEMPVMNVLPGMFVAELDRPWLETPFAVQGFVVRDDDDVLYMSRYVERVYVDVEYRGSDIFLHYDRKAVGHRKDTLELKAQFDQGAVHFEAAADTLDRVFNSLADHRNTDIEQVRNAVDPLIQGVFSNKNAMAALARLKKKSNYRYSHGVSMAVWAAILGQHLGLQKDELENLVVGCAMCDVGMARLPEELLNSPAELDARNRRLITAHTRIGVEMVKSYGEDSFDILSIIDNHHERHDGSGYPRGLSGASIPLSARIAGLVDTYDAMISDRPYAPARTSFEAILEIIDMADNLFQKALVEQFVQAIGMFPVGTLVELSSDEVAIVIAQNETRRLRPEVLVVMDADKNLLTQPLAMDLAEMTGGQRDAIWIKRELPRGTYGVNNEDYFI